MATVEIHHVGEIKPVEIETECTDLATATTLEIRQKDPAGVFTDLTATIKTGTTTTLTSTATLTLAGEYRFWAYAAWGGGTTIEIGKEVVHIQVYAEGEP
jgi:hypothetical protein